MYLRGLALDPSSIATGIMALMNFNRGGAQPAPELQSPINVTSTVQSTVSPQISPVFIQQQQPQNSAVNAATQQIAPAPQSATNGVPGANGAYAPTVPMTGAIPGVDTAAGYAPTGTPLLPATQNASPISGGMMLAAFGIVGAAFLLKKKKGKRK